MFIFIQLKNNVIIDVITTKYWSVLSFSNLLTFYILPILDHFSIMFDLALHHFIGVVHKNVCEIYITEIYIHSKFVPTTIVI